jgi:hypothetical protein
MTDRPVIIIDEGHGNLKSYMIAEKAIERLLSGIPHRYLSGLKSIVLNDSGTLNHQRKRQKTLWRKHKVAIRKSFGLYHQRWLGQPAWIEIFVDNIIRDWPPWLLKVPFFRDLFFGDVLFHEIGHHIHYTQAPEHKEREDVAEKWRKQLEGNFFRKKYWYIVFPILFIKLLLKPFGHLLSRRSMPHSRG